MTDSTTRRARIAYIAMQLSLMVWLGGAHSGGRTLSNAVQQFLVVSVLCAFGIWALPRLQAANRPMWLIILVLATLLALNVLAWEASPVLPE